MTRKDVLKEFIAAARRAGCRMTDREAAERLADAENTKPIAIASPVVYAQIVNKLRAIKTVKA